MHGSNWQADDDERLRAERWRRSLLWWVGCVGLTIVVIGAAMAMTGAMLSDAPPGFALVVAALLLGAGMALLVMALRPWETRR